MTTLQERLSANEVIILDGAIGTELQSMGIPMDDVAWCARGLDTHPDTVRELHEGYIRAGADVITTNTFSSARHVLEPAGLGDRVEELNTRAVKLAIEARERVAGDRAVFIAGAMSRFGGRSTPRETLTINYKEQAEILAGAGVDMFILEFLGKPLENTVLALEAAAATGLPIWLSLSCWEDKVNSVVRFGNRGYASAPRDRDDMLADPTITEALDRLTPLGGSAVLVIHSEVEDVAPALRAIRKHWQGPVGAYPHSGDWESPNWRFVNQISIQDYVTEAQGWVDSGAQIVGGCCGIGVEYIKLLRDGLPKSVSPKASGR